MSTDRETTGERSTGRQTIVVTGASGDIGLAIVERLITDGFHVAACCRSKTDRIGASFADPSKVTIHQLDLRNADSIKSCASAIIKERPYISGLVNSAGLAQGSLAAMTRISDMRDVFEVNLFGPLQFTQYITKKMMRQKSGAIVNITSTAGILGDPGTLAYGGSKAALAHASRVMAAEFGPLGIRVNAVAPSAVAWQWRTRWMRSPRKSCLIARLLPAKPCHRMLQTWLPICCQTMRLRFRDKS